MAKPRKPRTPEQAASFLRREIRKDLMADAYVEIVGDRDAGEMRDIEVSFPDESSMDQETIALFERTLLPKLLKKELRGWERSGEGVGAGSVEFYLHPKEA